MKQLYSNKLSVAIVGFSVAIIAITAFAETFYDDNVEEYVLTVNNEQLHFIAQPQAGYVLKTRDDIGSMDTLSRFLKSTGDIKISPVSGLGRKGVSVVYNERPAEENSKTIKTLKVHSEVQYTAPLFSSNGETVAVIPEIVVRVKPGTEIEQVQAICETADCTIIKRMEFTEQEYLLEVTGIDAAAVFTAVEQMNQISLIEWAAANIAFRPKLCRQAISGGLANDERLLTDVPIQDSNSPGVLPNDEYFPMQWHLHNTGQSGGTPGADIRAPEAWEITTGDPNIVVAVVDSGVDSRHPDLVGNLVAGYDFVDDDDKPDPALDHWGNGHGTACAGLIVGQGNNGIGVAGVTWNCKIMPVRIFGFRADGAGLWLTEAQEATAFRWAASNGADILSNSWGEGNAAAPIIHSAVADITKAGGVGRDGKGCIVLFASGNGSGPITWYPQKYPEGIAVGGTDHKDHYTWYTSYGPELDIAAPSGGGVVFPEFAEYYEEYSRLSTDLLWTTDILGNAGFSMFNQDPLLEDYTEKFAGTSAACPITAGVAALILSVDPNLTNLDVQRILYRSARDLGEPGWDRYYGWGRVDARAAVEMALNPPPSLFYVDDDALDDPGPGDPDSSDPNEDGSSEHPFDSIQEAINNAVPGETVIVLPGMYAGTGNRDISFLSRAITVRSIDPNDSEIVDTTVIDCQGTQTAQHQGFLFNKGESAQSVLAGLTIMNAFSSYGGGILCATNSSPTISKCVLRSNKAVKRGGGIYNSSGSPLVTNCIFSGNTAENGGALYNLSNARVVNCTFTNNSTTTGGGIHNQGGTLTLTNCILWNNRPVEVRVVIGTVSVSYSNIKGGFTGEGNIDADPLFADADNGDYHLKSQTGRWDPNSGSWVQDDVTSPCIDAGDPNSDWSGETWPHGEKINMGAYGGTRQASMSTKAEGMTLARVAYIFSNNAEAAQSFRSLLGTYGCSTTLINLDDVPAAPLDTYDLLIVGNDTGYISHWGNAESVAAIESAGLPVVGLGEGGYALFGQLGLSIGSPNGAHGSSNSIEVIDPNCSLYSTPYVLNVPEDRMLQLFTETKHVAIHLSSVPDTLMLLGAETKNLGYSPLIMEQNRYSTGRITALLWGFTESPEKMTEVGKTLFINVVIWTANEAWESNN